MRYLLMILAVFTGLATLGALAVFVLALIAWLKGGFNVVLPGLGLVVSGHFILIAFLIAAALLFAVTVLLARAISKGLR